MRKRSEPGVGTPHNVFRVRLGLTKKGGTLTTLTWQQAVDEALCVGWIDGHARARVAYVLNQETADGTR
jgi:hypothetical protein